ncbi:hypothetical protein SHIRM173S_12293 [Streptomyces hirsutus]
MGRSPDDQPQQTSPTGGRFTLCVDSSKKRIDKPSAGLVSYCLSRRWSRASPPTREAGYTFSDKEQGYQGVQIGDLVFHALDGFAGAVGVSDSNGKCSPVYHVCFAVGKNSTRFIAYTLRAMAFTGFLELQAGTVRQRSVDFRPWETFARLPIPAPSLEEQRRIVDFLDAETTRIDQLIHLYRRFNKLTAERSQRVLDEAVSNDMVSSLSRCTRSPHCSSTTSSRPLPRSRAVASPIVVDEGHLSAVLVEDGATALELVLQESRP